MGAKRYFQLFYVWPIVLPVVVLLLPAGVVANWVRELCREGLYSGGAPYLLFAGAMLFWSWDKEGASVRRSTYLAPLLVLPAFAISLAIAWRRASEYPKDLAELVMVMLLYGVAFAMPVLMLGYCYVGLVNLAFVILRSLGAFGDEPIVISAGFQTAGEYGGCGSPESPAGPSWNYGSVGQARNPRAVALSDGAPPTPGSVSYRGKSMCPDGSPYGFAGWEDEKMKGASRSVPESATASCAPREAATSSTPLAENFRATSNPVALGSPAATAAPVAPERPVPRPAAMGNVNARQVSSPASHSISNRTQTAGSAMIEEPRAERIAPVDKTGRCSTGYETGRAGTSGNAAYGRRASYRDEWQAQKKRTAKPFAEWNPLRTAALGLLAPLILLSAFAVWRHYGSHWRLSFSHRVVNSLCSGAPGALRGNQK